MQLLGEAPATQTWDGILVHETDTVTIEALPSDLPDHFEISVEGLMELDDQLIAGDLVIPSGVDLIADASTVIARIARPRLEVEEEEEELLEGEEAPEGEEGAAADGAGDESATDEN